MSQFRKKGTVVVSPHPNPLSQGEKGVRHALLFRLPDNNQSGVTLMEIIIAIVMIGIAIPAIMVPFSGLKDIKQPEYYVQISFYGQKQMEILADQTFGTLPIGTNLDCATFQGTVSNIDCDVDYVSTFDVETVAASALDTLDGLATFAKKVTLTVTYQGESLTFVSLFTQ